MSFAYNQMQERMKFVDSELEKFGKDLFCQIVEKAFSGNCDVEEYNFSNVKIGGLYSEFLEKYIDDKPSTSLKNEKIIEAIQKTEGCGLSGFPNGDIIYALLDEKLEELREEINTFSEDIYATINRFFACFPKAVGVDEQLSKYFKEENEEPSETDEKTGKRKNKIKKYKNNKNVIELNLILT